MKTQIITQLLPECLFSRHTRKHSCGGTVCVTFPSFFSFEEAGTAQTGSHAGVILLFACPNHVHLGPPSTTACLPHATEDLLV